MGLVAVWRVKSSLTRNKPVSPLLAAGFLTTVPPGKFNSLLLMTTARQEKNPCSHTGGEKTHKTMSFTL